MILLKKVKALDNTGLKNAKSSNYGDKGLEPCDWGGVLGLNKRSVCSLYIPVKVSHHLFYAIDRACISIK